MKKFAAVCGSGLGSSFMVEMNIDNVLKELGLTDYSVTHSDLGGASPDMADYFVVGRDLAQPAAHLGNLIVLNSIIDQAELKEKLEEVLKKDGLI